MHGHSSERPGMHDDAEAEQNSLAQAEERTRCAGLLRRSRSAARHHILTFKGSGSARGSRLGLQAWELISKSAEIRAEFRKTNSLYPY